MIGLILAGGRAQRMGGVEKALLQLGSRSLLDRVAGRLSAQCPDIVVNANAPATRQAAAAWPVVPDSLADFPGPLAGLLAGLDWAAEHRPTVQTVVSVPVDGPFLPRDLVSRLDAARGHDPKVPACARAGDRLQGVYGLWPVALRDDLRHALCVDGIRKVERWIARHDTAVATWAVDAVDPFFNINTPDDLYVAARLLAQSPEM